MNVPYDHPIVTATSKPHSKADQADQRSSKMFSHTRSTQSLSYRPTTSPSLPTFLDDESSRTNPARRRMTNDFVSRPSFSGLTGPMPRDLSSWNTGFSDAASSRPADPSRPDRFKRSIHEISNGVRSIARRASNSVRLHPRPLKSRKGSIDQLDAPSSIHAQLQAVVESPGSLHQETVEDPDAADETDFDQAVDSARETPIEMGSCLSRPQGSFTRRHSIFRGRRQAVSTAAGTTAAQAGYPVYNQNGAYMVDGAVIPSRAGSAARAAVAAQHGPSGAREFGHILPPLQPSLEMQQHRSNPLTISSPIPISSTLPSFMDREPHHIRAQSFQSAATRERPLRFFRPEDVYGMDGVYGYGSLPSHVAPVHGYTFSSGYAGKAPIYRHPQLEGTKASARADSLSPMLRSKRIDPATRLPPELMIEIMGFLDARSLNRSELVSRRWASYAHSQHCWRTSFYSSYKPKVSVTPQPRMMGGLGIGTKPNGTQDFKGMFKARHMIERNWSQCTPKAVYFTGHTDSVYCCQFDEDKLITGSRDRTIRVWSMKDFRCLKVIGGPASRPVLDDPEARLPTHPSATVVDRPSLNGTPEGNAIYHIPEQYHQASILCLHYDDTHMVTGSSDTTCLVWDLKTFEPVRRLRKHSAGVLDVCMDSTRIISCSKDATICIWDRETGQLNGVLEGHKGPVNAVQLRGNLLVSASGDGVAKLWNLETKQCVRDFPSKDRGLAAVEFSADTRFVLAGGNDQVIYKFDSQTGELLHTYRGHTGLVRSLFLDSVNGRVISGSYDQSMRVYSFDGTSRSTAPKTPTTAAQRYLPGVPSALEFVNNPLLQGGNNRVSTGASQTGNPAGTAFQADADVMDVDEAVSVGSEERNDREREIGSYSDWTTSWILAAKGDYRRIVATSQDGRAVMMDYGWEVDGVEMLRGEGV